MCLFRAPWVVAGALAAATSAGPIRSCEQHTQSKLLKLFGMYREERRIHPLITIWAT